MRPSLGRAVLKKLLILILVIGAGVYFYRTRISGPPQNFDNPVYGEIRVNATIEGRDLEMALFVRSADETDCKLRAARSWAVALVDCPACDMKPVQCQAKLPPRYARLFDDVPIPSTYLSATAGKADERDGRLVIYGLTDQEGALACEQMLSVLRGGYHGTAHCVKASGK
jgi:hypothetical protein